MTFEEMSEKLRAVAAQAGPSVVGIGQRWGVGSGVSLGGGRILTNAHNVRREEVSVTLGDGATLTGASREPTSTKTSPSLRSRATAHRRWSGRRISPR